MKELAVGIKTTSLFLTFLLCFKVEASLYVQGSFGFHSDSHSDSTVFDLDYSRVSTQGFVGVHFFVPWIIVGGNVNSWKRDWSYTINDDDFTSSFDFLEIGPRVILFLNSSRNFYLSAAYHGYVKGSSQLGDEDVEIRGRSKHYALGLQMPLSRQLFFGLSFNYHQTTIRREITDLQTQEMNYGITGMYPAIELSYRFNRLFNWRRSGRQSFPRSWIHD